MEKICCGPCTQHDLKANSNSYANYNINWISLLESRVPFLCPTCGPVYSIAKLVGNSQKIPSQLQEIAAGVCLGMLIWTGASIINDLLKSLAKA